MTMFTFLEPLFRTHRGAFAAALGLSFLTLLAGIALLGVSGWFLTAAALTTLAMSFNLFGPSSLIRGLSLLRILCRYGEKLLGHDATLRLLSTLRATVFARLFQRLPLAQNRFGHGDLVSRLTGDIDALEAIFIVGIGPLVASLLSGAAMAAVLFAMLPAALPAYGLAVGCSAILVPVLLFLSSRRAGATLVAACAQTRTAVLGAIDGHADLVSFGQTAMAEMRFAEFCGRIAAARRSLDLRASLATTTIQILTGVALLAVLLTGIPALRAGAIDGPVLVGLLLATLGSFEASSAVVRGVARFGTALSAARRIQDIGADEPVVRRPAVPRTMPAGSRLVVDGLSFGYDPLAPILRDIRLEVEPGERIALIGRSGCGKSTLLSLLVRLHDVHGGRILFGGEDFSRLDGDEIRKRIILLAQDAPVFMGTIRDNLLIGDPQASDARLMDVLASVRLDKLLRTLSEGLDTFVGETGRTLSGGETRRLCLARALLSKADILLLDEPTSNLDPEAEAAFFADLAAIADGRTIIVATHASASVLQGLQCYRLEDGRLAAAGF